MLCHVQADPSSAAWSEYIREGQEHLQAQEVDFNRPAANTDRLYMNIGGSDVIEVGHPPMPDEVCAIVLFTVSVFSVVLQT